MLKQLKLNQKQSSGFTMIELAVTLAIVGVLMFFAIPSYNEFSNRQSISNETNDLLGDLGFARSLAIENSNAVTIIPVSNTVNWSTGWTISQTLADGTLEVIRTKNLLSNNVSMIATDNVITYNSLGNLSSLPISFNVGINPGFSNFLSIRVLASGMASSSKVL